MIPFLAGAIDRAIAWRTGRRFPEYLAQYRAMERWTAEAFEAWRWERLRAQLDHAARTVPYWRETFARLGARPGDFTRAEHLAALPATTKELVNAAGDAMTSTQPEPGRVTRSSTGGSTGRNVWFLIDGEAHDRRRAAGRLTEEWDGVRPGTRTATIWGAALEQSASRGAALYDRLTNRVFLSAYGVGPAELEAYGERLARLRPEVISSYPSILLDLARRWGRERCRRLGVRIIYCSAEALYEPVRAELEDLFGAVVRNRYACREFGMVAADCPLGGGLHLMDMRLFVELLPTAEDPALRELVITDLDNRVMPLIRYRIDDLARPAAGPCRCGRPFARVEAVEGRVLDVVTTPDGRAFGGTFFTLVLRPFDRSIRQFQVVQDRPDHLVVRLVPGPGYDDAARERVRAVLAKQFGPALAVELAEVDEIAPLASGKRRFVVRETGRDGRR